MAKGVLNPAPFILLHDLFCNDSSLYLTPNGESPCLARKISASLKVPLWDFAFSCGNKYTRGCKHAKLDHSRVSFLLVVCRSSWSHSLRG